MEHSDQQQYYYYVSSSWYALEVRLYDLPRLYRSPEVHTLASLRGKQVASR